MEDNFNRYHCQIALPGFGTAGQMALKNARVLIVGAGGLGCPVGQYLAAAGIGRLGIADDDIISETNLHRQILFTPEDVGSQKAVIATRRLQRQNPDIEIKPLCFRVDPGNIMELLSDYDLVVDGTDNFETKYLLNDACVMAGKPLVYGAIYRYEGQVVILNVPMENGQYSANYRDIFPEAPKADDIPNCSEGGVLPTLAGMIGCMQATEVIKYFTNKNTVLAGKLSVVNIQNGSHYQVTLQRNKQIQITSLKNHMSIDTIDYDTLQKGDYQLVDVRSFKEHAAFNIGGTLLPLSSFDGYLNALIQELDLERPIACYCATGKRSREAAMMIKEIYPDAQVYSLKRGIQHLIDAHGKNSTDSHEVQR